MTVVGFVISIIVEILLTVGMHYISIGLVGTTGILYYVLFGALIAITVLLLVICIVVALKAIFPFTWYYLLIQSIILLVNIILIVKIFKSIV